MATPPRVTNDEISAAIERIRRRRMKCRYKAVDSMPDDPWLVLDWIVAHSGKDVPPRVRQADLRDFLRIKVGLWWLLQRHEKWCWDRAEDWLVPHMELGVEVGVKRRHSVRSRHDGLIGLFSDHGKPDPLLARRHRRPSDADVKRAQDADRWLKAHTLALRVVAQHFMEHEPLCGDETGSLLRYLWTEYVQPEQFTTGIIGQLEDCATEMREEPRVVAIRDTSHPLLLAFMRWEQLHDEYRAVADQPAGEEG